jgi:hypothetical protein
MSITQIEIIMNFDKFNRQTNRDVLAPLLKKIGETVDFEMGREDTFHLKFENNSMKIIRYLGCEVVEFVIELDAIRFNCALEYY